MDISLKNVVPAVKVTQAWKGFIPGSFILQNMNMTVPSGTIYSLLGSSGCGKTTLLSCIVGLQNVDEGEILVFGLNPVNENKNFKRRIGYMPQDITLYEFLTIKETLQYFGRICGMTEDEIQKQILFLVEFLKLPNMNRKITSLSGGQKRRSSLAASLIHSPDLLILDEPTVGLDPVLRESIWQHLHELVNTRGTTVIITTHYVEEARHSDTIGLMRNGRLLVEQAPKLLLEEYKADLLEEIVVKLCQNDQKNAESLPVCKYNPYLKDTVIGLKYQKYLQDFPQLQNKSVQKYPKETFRERVGFRINRVKAKVIKNYLNLFRNPILMIGSICLPAVQAILIGLVFGREPRTLSFGVVNNEFPNWEVNCFQNTSGCATDLSCKYIGQLMEQNGQLDIIQVISEEEALKKVELGQMWGYIVIPENYSGHFGLRGMSMRGLFADNETLEGSVIKVRMDMSPAAFMIKNLFTSLDKYVKNSVLECGGNPKEAELEFEFSDIYNLYGSYVDYIIPGVLLLNINMIANGLSAVTLVTDRSRGTLDRSRVAGLKTFDILFSYFIADATPAILQALLASGILIFGFSLNIQGPTVIFIFIAILAGINGEAFGLLVGTFSKDEFEALVWSMLIYQPMMLYIGLIFPLEVMPKIVQRICHCLPLTLAVESMRNITSRGLGLLNQRVWEGIAVLVGWTVLDWIFVIFRFQSSLKK